jgi:hypothetical protein
MGTPKIMLFLFGAGFALAFFAAWITHVVVCLSDDKWGFLIAGAICFPVAIVHGIGIWFGIWH